MKIATVARIVEAWAEDAKSVRVINDPKCSTRRFYVMQVAHPGPVDYTLARSLVKELKTRDVRALRTIWESCNVLEQEDGFWGINLDVFRERWEKHCVIILTGSVPQCSCWLRVQQGHCVHSYACLEIAGVKSFVGPPIAKAKAKPGPRQKRSRSEEMDTPSRKR